MKYIILFSLMCSSMVSLAQEGVAINNDGSTPNASAMLDVKSTSRGILVPRMTSAQRAAIVSPARGLMVYDNTSNTFWFYNGTAWQEMTGGGGSSNWNLSSTHIYSNNSGNVGIGKSNPLHKLDVAGNIRIDTESPALLFRANNLFQISEITFENSNSSNLSKIMAAAGSLQFQTGSPAKYITMHTSGALAIGDNNATGMLVVDAMNYSYDAVSINDQNPTIQLKSSGVNKGFLQLSGDNIRIGTNSSNDAGYFVIRNNGADRVFVSPTGNLHIPSGSDASLTSNGFLTLGNVNSSNIIFDNNEIVARNNGAYSTLILQNDGGNVRIGNATVPTGYKFAVAGKVICEEVKVKLASSGWPDYVFDQKYRLMPLNELKKFIDTNKHLPGIPAAAVVEKEGFEMGEMQRKLLEKVEELTLHILELDQKIRELENKLSAKN